MRLAGSRARVSNMIQHSTASAHYALATHRAINAGLFRCHQLLHQTEHSHASHQPMLTHPHRSTRIRIRNASGRRRIPTGSRPGKSLPPQPKKAAYCTPAQVLDKTTCSLVEHFSAPSGSAWRAAVAPFAPYSAPHDPLPPRCSLSWSAVGTARCARQPVCSSPRGCPIIGSIAGALGVCRYSLGLSRRSIAVIWGCCTGASSCCPKGPHIPCWVGNPLHLQSRRSAVLSISSSAGSCSRRRWARRVWDLRVWDNRVFHGLCRAAGWRPAARECAKEAGNAATQAHYAHHACGRHHACNNVDKNFQNIHM